MIEVTELSISQASLEDLDALEAIENRVFSCPWSRKAFEAELSGNEFSFILIARCPDGKGNGALLSCETPSKVVGYICIWVVFEELRFMNIAIEADMRRKGIGSELMKKSMETGAKQGAERALLEVRASNKAAQAFYRHWGFELYGKRRQYYTNPDEDAMLMAREFKPKTSV